MSTFVDRLHEIADVAQEDFRQAVALLTVPATEETIGSPEEWAARERLRATARQLCYQVVIRGRPLDIAGAEFSRACGREAFALRLAAVPNPDTQ
jgi:hypothetical protein